MSKIAYFECPTGIAGDMCLGALLDVGVPLAYLQDQLQKLGIGDRFRLTSEPVKRQGQQATLAQVVCEKETHHRHLSDITTMIAQAQLPARVEQWSIEVFSKLAIAESKAHGVSPESVHFHEVGAVDAIVDIVGTCLGLDWLCVDELHCSALPTGGGTVKTAHGELSVPVPAVLQLWSQRQVPVYSNGIQKELVTPTGAALMVALAQSFGEPPPLTLHKVGLGAGQTQMRLPNAVRIWLGEAPDNSNDLESVMLLETQVDDMNPQVMGVVFERLLDAGALDVWTQSVAMKKQRSGLLISVLCGLELVATCEDILFQETTTLGIRRSRQERRILRRSFETVETEYGEVAIKLAYRGQEVWNVQPEYDDCIKLARKHGVPWWQVQQLAVAQWHTIRNQRP
ncbi:MAG: nickel pincer cofactor biosynthesis protein LarC [Cyanobacteria bacterium P01_F01_bin.42]